MQASTSEQYAVSIMIEEALTRALIKAGATDEELVSLGFRKDFSVAQGLREF
jgi:hypothetical protein